MSPTPALLMRMHPLRVVLLALVVLLSAYIQFSVAARTSIDGPVRADAVKYVAYAWNLKHYQTFSHAPFWTPAPSANPLPDKLTLPGYPVFLSTLLGPEVDQSFVKRVVMAQAAMGIGTCLLTLLLALRMMPFGFAIAAGVLTAISPHLATMGTYLLTEALFTFLVTATLYLGACAVAPGSRLRRAALAGAMLGVASLVRPQMELLPWLLLVLCFAIPSWRVHSRKMAIALACFLLVTAPWQLRNLSVANAAGDPDLLVSTLYHGSFPNLMYENDPRTAGYAYSYDTEAAKHSAGIPAVLNHIAHGFREHPLRYLGWYALGKPLCFLSWEDPANGGDIYIFPVVESPYLSDPFFAGLHALAYWMHWPLTLLALVALVAMLAAARRPTLLLPDRTQQTAFRLLALTLAYVLAMHMIGAPYPRYSTPFRPLVYLLAMTMVAAIWHCRPRQMLMWKNRGIK